MSKKPLPTMTSIRNVVPIEVQYDFRKYTAMLQKGPKVASPLVKLQSPVWHWIVGSFDSGIVAVQLSCPPTSLKILQRNLGFPICVRRIGKDVVEGLFLVRRALIAGKGVKKYTEHYKLFLERQEDNNHEPHSNLLTGV
jgi:hypothetical protein